MTDDRMARLEQIQKSTDGDFLRAIAEHTLHRLMAFEVDGLIGASRHERSDERSTYRNGSRPRQLETRLGTLDLKIPKLRQGSYFPAFLEPRKTAEKALTAVIQEAWNQGVSTRKVDDLVQALGMTGISTSQVSALCQDRSRRRQPAMARRGIEAEMAPETCEGGSTPACCLSWNARWTATGPISGWTPPTSRSARTGASSQSPR